MTSRGGLPDDGILDEVAIARRAAGDTRVRLTRRERLEVVRRLHSQGLQDSSIGELVGMHDRQVRRDRVVLGLPANPDPNQHPVSAEHFWARGKRHRASFQGASS